MAALLQTHEPENSLFNALAHGEKTVVLQERSLLVTQRRSNILAFFLGENDAIELFVYHMVLLPTELISFPSIFGSRGHLRHRMHRSPVK